MYWQVKHFDINALQGWPLCCLGWAGFSDTNILSTVHILAKAQFPSNAEMCRHCEQNFFDFLHDKDCLHNNLSAVFTCMYHTCCIHSGALLIYTPVRQLSHWTVQYRNLNAVHTCSKHPLKNDKRGSTVHSHYTVNVLILNVDGLSTQWTQRCCHALLPGPVTLVLQRRESLNSSLNPGRETVGVRVPDHAFTLHWWQSLVPWLTSANISNQQSTLCVKVRVFLDCKCIHNVWYMWCNNSLVTESKQ